MRTNKRVSAVIIKKAKILLIHRFKNGSEYWVIPGGGVESDESLEEALKREVLEEIGLGLINFKFINKDTDRDRDIENHLYECCIEEGDVSLGGPEKEKNCKDNKYILEWVELSKIHELDLYPEIIKKLF